MCERTVIQALFNSLATQNYEQALTLLCDDFRYSGGTAVPLNRHQWLCVHQALMAAMPDMALAYCPEKVEYGIVIGTWQISGTQTAELTLPIPGVPKLPSTGRRVALPQEKMEIAVENKKIKTIRVRCTPQSSFSGIIDQISRASAN